MKKIAFLSVLTRSQWAFALHGDQNGECVNIAGPGHSKDDRSLGIWFDPKAPSGFRLHSLAHDDPALCRNHVKSLLKATLAKRACKSQFALSVYPNTDASVSPAKDASAEQFSKVALALKVWSQRVPIGGTVAANYLKARQCPASAEVIATGAIGFHAGCPFGQNRFPAMLALVTNAVTGEPIGIHRTALRNDGLGKRKMPGGGAPKRMLGSSKGGVVRLQPSAPSLGIAEGIETALSASKIFKMPVWAALAANGLANFPILPGMKFLRIFADHDVAGLSAARECKRRYKKAGIEVEVRYPPQSGDDWNDALQQETNQCL